MRQQEVCRKLFSLRFCCFAPLRYNFPRNIEKLSRTSFITKDENSRCSDCICDAACFIPTMAGHGPAWATKESYFREKMAGRLLCRFRQEGCAGMCESGPRRCPGLRRSQPALQSVAIYGTDTILLMARGWGLA